MTSSAQLERESEEARSEFSRTLDELRERITPGQLLDEAVDYAQDTTGGEFAHNLRRQVAANPLPVMLIGAGIGWLALAKRNHRPNDGRARAGFKSGVENARDRGRETARAAGERMDEWSAQAGETAQQWSSQATETASDWSAQAGEAVSRLGDTAESWSDQARDGAARAKARMADGGSSLSDGAASAFRSMKSGANDAASAAGNMAADAYGRAADAAARTGSAFAQSAGSFGQRTARVGGDALAFCKTQPLLLAGLGLALGAVLGSIIPSSDAEDRLMGEASDHIKEKARDAAQDQVEKVRDSLQSGMEQAGTQAEDLARSVGDAAVTSLVPQEEDTSARLPLE